MPEVSVSSAPMAPGQLKVHGQRILSEVPRVQRPRPREALAANLKSLARTQAVRSRRAQGLPDHITDPVTLDYVARLLMSAKEPPPAGIPP
jgi:hypothetical protein